MIFAGVFGSEPLTFTYLGTATGTNAVGSFNINVDVGAGNANKTVLIVGSVSYSGGITETGFVSLTFGGVSATVRRFKGLDDGTQGIGSWIATAEVSTAGTIAIAGTYAPSAVSGDTRLDIYTTIDDFTVVESLDGFANTSVSPIAASLNIDVSSGGTVIAGMVSSEQTNGTTWTGVTEIYDSAFNSTFRASGGAEGSLNLESNRLVRASQAISLGSEGMVLTAISMVKA